VLLAASGAGCGKKEDEAEKPAPAGRPGDGKSAYHGVHGKTDSKWRIHGWAWDRNNPDATLKVDIHEGDQLLATIPASVFRQDLYDAKIGTGKYGFAWQVPASLRDGRPHDIRITISGTSIPLKNTPRTITAP